MSDLVLKKMSVSVLIFYLHVSLLYLLQLFFHDFYLVWFQGVLIFEIFSFYLQREALTKTYYL